MRAYIVGPCPCCHGWALFRWGMTVLTCQYDYEALASACDELNHLTLFEHTKASGRILERLAEVGVRVGIKPKVKYRAG